MKLNKLYTLSQFVDLIQKMELGKNEEEFCDFRIMGIGWIYGYNEFLKQRLTSEWFINDIEKPTIESFKNKHIKEEYIESHYNARLEYWNKREKKLIFNPIQFKEIMGMSIEKFADDKEKKPFRDNNYKDYSTIGEFAESTHGYLEIKNVEI